MHRSSRGLIAYGIVGLVVAAIGFGALVWVNGRIGSLRGEAEANVARLATTMELTAKVLHDASATAESFSATVDRSAQAVSSAAVTITETRSDLSALEAQLGSVSILGVTPLSSAGEAVGRIAASMGVRHPAEESRGDRRPRSDHAAAPWYSWISPSARPGCPALTRRRTRGRGRRGRRGPASADRTGTVRARTGVSDPHAYAVHYNRGRPHRALALATPVAEDEASMAVSPRDVHRRDLLGGLIHEYHGAAA